MALGTYHSTITTHANFIPEVWAKKAQIAYEKNLVFAKRVIRFDSDVAKYGDTIHIPKISNPSATAKAAETPVAFNSSAVEGKVDVTVNQHYYSAYLLEDILNTQSAYNLEDMFAQKAGYAVAVALDTYLATLVASATQTVGTVNTDTVDDAGILRAIQYLDDADCPEEDRSFIMQPVIRAAMLRIDKFVRAEYVNEKPVVSGHIGQVYGVPCFVSNNVYTSGTSTYNAIFHKEAFACAVQKNMNIETGRVIEYMGDAIIASNLFGASEYRSTAYVAVLS